MATQDSKTSLAKLKYKEVKASFKLVVALVFTVFIICTGICLYLSLQPTLTEAGSTLFKGTLSMVQMGGGAIFGLIGGKVIP